MKARGELVVRDGESIQSAIERVPEGGVIRLKEGRWEENLVIEKSLTLCGAGKENTSIRVGSSEGEQSFYIAAPEKGKEIRVCLRDLSLSGAPEWGVTAEEGVHLSLQRCALSENKVGLMLASDARASLDECLIYKNDLGITLWEDSKITIRRSTFIENNDGVDLGNREALIEGSSFRGHEVAIGGSARKLTIRECIVEDGEWGINLCIWITQALIERCRVQRNRCDGIEISMGARATIRECIVSNNKCGISVNQGWSFSPGSRAVIERCVISGNEIGIWVTEPSQATITGCRIRGGREGLYLDRGGVEVTIEGNRIRRNRRGISYFSTESFYDGYIAGRGNTIEGNAEEDIHEELGFLVTKAGGRFDSKGTLPLP